MDVQDLYTVCFFPLIHSFQVDLKLTWTRPDSSLVTIPKVLSLSYSGTREEVSSSQLEKV